MHFDPGFLRPAENISTHILRHTFILAENHMIKSGLSKLSLVCVRDYLLRVGIRSLLTEMGPFYGKRLSRFLHLYFPRVLIVLDRGCYLFRVPKITKNGPF